MGLNGNLAYWEAEDFGIELLNLTLGELSINVSPSLSQAISRFLNGFRLRSSIPRTRV